LRITFAILFSFFFSNDLFSQWSPSYSDFEGRKGKITLNFGVEYRVTPLYEFDETLLRNFAGSFTNVDNLHRRPAFSYGLEVFLSRNLSLTSNIP